MKTLAFTPKVNLLKTTMNISNPIVRVQFWMYLLSSEQKLRSFQDYFFSYAQILRMICFSLGKQDERVEYDLLRITRYRTTCKMKMYIQVL